MAHSPRPVPTRARWRAAAVAVLALAAAGCSGDAPSMEPDASRPARRDATPARPGAPTITSTSTAPGVPPSTAPPITVPTTAAPAAPPAAPPPTTLPLTGGVAAPAVTTDCTTALAYLAAHQAPGFVASCGPGIALGRYGYTCWNRAPYCGNGGRVIHIACPAPFVYMNEAHNSWSLTGSRSGIDPYGQGTAAEQAYCDRFR